LIPQQGIAEPAFNIKQKHRQQNFSGEEPIKSVRSGVEQRFARDENNPNTAQSEKNPEE